MILLDESARDLLLSVLSAESPCGGYQRVQPHRLERQNDLFNAPLGRFKLVKRQFTDIKRHTSRLIETVQEEGELGAQNYHPTARFAGDYVAYDAPLKPKPQRRAKQVAMTERRLVRYIKPRYRSLAVLPKPCDTTLCAVKPSVEYERAGKQMRNRLREVLLGGSEKPGRCYDSAAVGAFG